MDQVHAPLPIASRLRLMALAMPRRRSASSERRSGTALCRGVGLVCGLYLVAAVASARGFDGELPPQQTAPDLVLESSTVPESANWVVLDATGIAAWRAQGETRWRRFKRGEVLPPGSEIETGSDGEIMLVAGGDQLTIAPQGRLIVPLAQSGQDRRLRHERGRILVQIESRAARDVRVDTPLLSLGIKGTEFEVQVDPEQNSVVVHEGEVEVTTPNQPDPVDLGAGEGLRQTVGPDIPTRFTLPAPDTRAGSNDAPAWRLPPSRTNAPAAPETVAPVAPSDSAVTRTAPSERLRGNGTRAVRPAPRGATGSSWLDELASSWAYVAVAGVVLLILTIPGVAFAQNLRAQWRSQPRTQGRRRRELVRG
jgi:hypothetical protein